MKKSKILSISFFLMIAAFLNPKVAFAQNALNNSFGIQIGTEQQLLKDLNFSPLNYKGSGINFGLAYENEKAEKGNNFALSLGGRLSELNTVASEELESFLLAVHLKSHFLKRLNAETNRLRFYAGLEYRLDVNYLAFDSSYPAFSFLVSHNLNAKGRLVFDINEKQRLVSSLSLPLLSAINRPPYNGFDEILQESSEFAVIFDSSLKTWNTYQNLFWDIGYEIELGRRFGASINYGLEVTNFTEGDAFKSMVNQLKLGFKFKF